MTGTCDLDQSIRLRLDAIRSTMLDQDEQSSRDAQQLLVLTEAGYSKRAEIQLFTGMSDEAYKWARQKLARAVRELQTAEASGYSR